MQTTIAHDPVQAKAAAKPETTRREPPLIVRIFKSGFMKWVLRTAGGVMAIVIYFADLISDVQVPGLYILPMLLLFRQP